MSVTSIGLSLMLWFMPGSAPRVPDVAALNAAAWCVTGNIPGNGPADTQAVPSGTVASDGKKSGEANITADASSQATSGSAAAGPTPAGSQAETKPVEKEAKEKDKPTPRIESWGEFEPGDGFLIGRSSAGELAISGYAMVRYINQMPAEQTFTDHLGNEHAVDARNDIFPHRAMIFLKGWLGTPSWSTTSSCGR